VTADFQADQHRGEHAYGEWNGWDYRIRRDRCPAPAPARVRVQPVRFAGRAHPFRSPCQAGRGEALDPERGQCDWNSVLAVGSPTHGNALCDTRAIPQLSGFDAGNLSETAGYPRSGSGTCQVRKAYSLKSGSRPRQPAKSECCQVDTKLVNYLRGAPTATRSSLSAISPSVLSERLRCVSERLRTSYVCSRRWKRLFVPLTSPTEPVEQRQSELDPQPT
jgi:hypothetical protein